MNKDMNENGIFGNFKILNREFCYDDGILKKSMIDGSIFLADETNIAPEEVISHLDFLSNYPQSVQDPNTDEKI